MARRLGAPDCTSGVCAGNICQVASCSDAVLNQDETAVDCGGTACVACGVNTAPLVHLLVSPGAGSPDGTPTVFVGDASGTTDREDTPEQLAYAWDWESDGVIDGSGATSTHSYGSEGTFEARLTVQDRGGLTGTASFLVVVASDSRVLRVTTAADEGDTNATPASPGGTGFSLREAMEFANGAAGKQVIIVPSGFVIDIGGELPALSDAAGIDLIGDGAVIDGTGIAQVDDCLAIDTSETRVFGLEIENCQRSPLRVGFVSNCQFSRLNLHDSGQGAFVNGPGNVFGPGNVIRRSAEHGLTVYDATIVVDNEFHDNAERGIDLTGSSDGALVIGNVVTGSDPGILFGAGASGNVVIHNTVHQNLSDGVFMAGAANTGTLLQNNIFSQNGGFGLRAGDGQFTPTITTTTSRTRWAIAASAVRSALAAHRATRSSSTRPPTTSVSAPAAPTWIPVSTRAATSTGAVPGLFNGSNPDVGARESP